MIIKITSGICRVCAASFTYDELKGKPALCCICARSSTILRQHMEDCKHFMLQIGNHRMYPEYYLFFNSSAIPIGSIVAYPFLTSIRLGMITEHRVGEGYSLIKPIPRMLDAEEHGPGEMDEIKWDRLLCKLKEAKCK